MSYIHGPRAVNQEPSCSVLQCVAVFCSVLQCVAVCCSVLQCVAVCCSVLKCVASPKSCHTYHGRRRSGCNTLQHTANRSCHTYHGRRRSDCNTLQHTATHCKSAVVRVCRTCLIYVTLQYAARHCKTLQTHCNTLQYVTAI